MMLWKGYQNVDFFHKIWKTYLEWYTGALGMEYLKCLFCLCIIYNVAIAMSIITVPSYESNTYNSFEDRAPVDEI